MHSALFEWKVENLEHTFILYYLLLNQVYFLLFCRLLGSHNLYCTKGKSCTESYSNNVKNIRKGSFHYRLRFELFVNNLWFLGFNTDRTIHYQHEKFHEVFPNGGPVDMKSKCHFRLSIIELLKTRILNQFSPWKL